MTKPVDPLEKLHELTTRLRQTAEKLPGKPYDPAKDPALQPQTLALVLPLPAPPADAPLPPVPHQETAEREPGEDDAEP